jgi:hypothetical protein
MLRPMHTFATGASDPRICFGVNCTYWGICQNAGVQPGTGLPCCPHCFGLLWEYADEAEFMADAQEYQDAGHPGFVTMVMWMKDRYYCYKDLEACCYEYERETSNSVTL